MKDYVFILGRDIELSIAEILSYLNSYKIHHDFKFQKNKVLVLGLPKLDFNKLVNKLGGTVKIGEVLFEDDSFNEKLDKLELNLQKKKVIFSLSTYNNSPISNEVYSYFKKRFRNESIKFVSKRFIDKDSPSRLIKDSSKYDVLDIIVFSHYMARTIAISNPKLYKKLEKRPENDFLKSTSPRIAKILINLSQVKENETLLDPFCGIGSILQQAMIMNINVVGIDNDQKSVLQTSKNLKWTKERFNINKNFRVINGDSRFIDRLLQKKSVDVIVSEPYLGPYIKKQLAKEQAIKICKQLEAIYEKFFYGIKFILKENGILVFILPVFKTKENTIVSVDVDRLLNRSYEINKINDKIKIPLIFHGMNNKIIRQIYVLKLKT